MGQFSFNCEECGGKEQYDWTDNVIVEFEVVRARPIGPIKFNKPTNRPTNCNIVSAGSRVSPKPLRPDEIHDMTDAALSRLVYSFETTFQEKYEQGNVTVEGEGLS